MPVLKTPSPRPEQTEFFNERINSWGFPETKKLQDKLRKIAGNFLVPMPEPQCDAERVLNRGTYLEGYLPKPVKGIPGACHTNAARSYLLNADTEDLYTGYCYNQDDGLWRMHSWTVVKKTNTILESTCPRDAYFGVKLLPYEALKFSMENVDLPPEEIDFCETIDKRMKTLTSAKEALRLLKAEQASLYNTR